MELVGKIQTYIEPDSRHGLLLVAACPWLARVSFANIYIIEEPWCEDPVDWASVACCLDNIYTMQEGRVQKSSRVDPNPRIFGLFCLWRGL